MITAINKCVKYSHLIPILDIFDEGKLIDVIELKIDLFCASMENKYKNKPAVLTDEENKELDKWGSAMLLKDKILQYNECNDDENKEDMKIEIIKLIYEII